MSLHDLICDAFCGSLRVTPIKLGFAISSAFPWMTGDNLTFYARRQGQLFRFEDDGLTVSELEGAGVDLESSSRREILADLLQEHRVQYDQTEVLFHTDWLLEKELAHHAVSFFSFMLRIQDMLFTSRSRVAGTFRDDLVTALIERFGAANVERQSSPVPGLGYYVVDITVRHKSGTLAAIFPGTSEQKALEAVLFAKELELKRIDNIVPFLIYEEEASIKINKQTRTKALNSSLQLASWEGGKMDVIDKVDRYVSQTPR